MEKIRKVKLYLLVGLITSIPLFLIYIIGILGFNYLKLRGMANPLCILLVLMLVLKMGSLAIMKIIIKNSKLRSFENYILSFTYLPFFISFVLFFKKMDFIKNVKYTSSILVLTSIFIIFTYNIIFLIVVILHNSKFEKTIIND